MERVVQAQKEPVTHDLDRGASSLHEGWIAGLLVAVILVSVTMSVAAANWADGLYLLPYAALGGMFFGALVSRLRLIGWLAHPLALLEGAFVTAWLASFLILPHWATWNEKLVIVEGRVGHWLNQVMNGGIGNDALIFVLILLAISWLIGYIAAWSVFRVHQPWGVILPAGAGLLANLFYAPPQSGLPLMVFLLCALLLLVRTTLLKRQQTWQRMAIRYANDIGLDFLTYGVVFSGIIILASWLVPPTAPGPQWVAGLGEVVRGPWQDLSDSMTRMFSTVRTANTGAPTTFFGSSLSMGGPIHLGDRPVMDIRSDYGRYWRAAVFDKYTGSGWVSTANLSGSYEGNDPRVQTPPASLRRVVTETVQILLPGDDLIMSASQPVQVYAPTNVRYLADSDPSGQTFLDIAMIRSQKALRAGDTYQAESSLSGADEASLRAADTNYSPFIIAHYLSLPTTVPDRVRQLAFQITAGTDNNYDKARAIEQYLRSHIVYDDSVAPPPVNRDAVDYTLFDRPAGYCNYYASAMAVLAREVGIPARVASGYANSESDHGVYHITEGNAHSWPELYFGSLGWVEFEPTSSKPEIDRPVADIAGGGAEPTPTPSDLPALRGPISQKLETDKGANTSLDANGFGLRLPTGPAGIALTASSSALVLALLLLGVMQFNWSRRVRLLPPGARAWAEVYRFAGWIGLRDRAEATPYERSDELARLMPEAQAAIADITSLYVRERYGAQALTLEERLRVLQASARLRARVLRGGVERIVGGVPLQLAHAARSRLSLLKRLKRNRD